MRLQDSFLYAAACFFRGGRGASAVCISGTECYRRAGAGGSGLNSLSAGKTPVTLACKFFGGPGGFGANCSGCFAGSTGPPTEGPFTKVPLGLRSYEVETPVRSGTSYQLTVHCPRGEYVWSVFSKDLAPKFLPELFGTQVGAFPVTLVFEGVADSTNSLVKSVPIPPLVGLTSFERLFAQGLFFDEFNNAYLGSPSVLVVVN